MVGSGLILLDTNIFLELLMDRNKAGDCAALLEKVSTGEREAVVSHFSLHSVEAVIGEGDGLLDFLRNVENSIGLSVHDTDVSDEIAVSLLSKTLGRDFDDSLQYYLAKKLGVDCIVSFDRHFDGLDVKRSEPSELLPAKGAHRAR
jgi:predicted nucleic acid-binding protein